MNSRNNTEKDTGFVTKQKHPSTGCFCFLCFLCILEGQVAKHNYSLRSNSVKHFLPGLAGSSHCGMLLTSLRLVKAVEEINKMTPFFGCHFVYPSSSTSFTPLAFLISSETFGGTTS